MPKEWIVHLTGPDATLERMAEVFADPECRISREGERYVLRSARFQPHEDMMKALNEADSLIRRATEVMNLYGGQVGQIQTGGMHWLDAMGNEQPSVTFAFGTVYMLSPEGLKRLQETRPGGSKLATELLGLVERDPLVGTILRLVGVSGMTWGDLYVLMETIANELRQSAMRDWSPIAARGWATEDLLKDLKQNANFERHAKGLWDPPKRPIPLPTAVSIAKEIVWKWIEERL